MYSLGYWWYLKCWTGAKEANIWYTDRNHRTLCGSLHCTSWLGMTQRQLQLAKQTEEFNWLTPLAKEGKGFRRKTPLVKFVSLGAHLPAAVSWPLFSLSSLSGSKPSPFQQASASQLSQ